MATEIDLGNQSLELINYQEWQEYLTKAHQNSETNFSSFFDENPNSPDQFNWSFWQVKYPANDARYAIYEIKEKIELLLAEINFFHYFWTRSKPKFSKDSHPRDRWSHLQTPYTLLAFKDDKFQNYFAVDYDYRGERLADRTFMSNIESIDNLPQFYKKKDEVSKIENIVINSLILYQQGITEPSIPRSLLDFWRGIEHFVGDNRNINTSEIADRAYFAFKYIKDPDTTLSREIKEAMIELSLARNKLVHSWPNARLKERHRDAAKILLDSLIKLFLNNQNHFQHIDTFQKFLKTGANDVRLNLTQKLARCLQVHF
jgi:hypothetical protein